MNTETLNNIYEITGDFTVMCDAECWEYITEAEFTGGKMHAYFMAY